MPSHTRSVIRLKVGRLLLLAIGMALGAAPIGGLAERMAAGHAQPPHASTGVLFAQRDERGGQGARGAGAKCQDRGPGDPRDARRADVGGPFGNPGDDRGRALAAWRALERCFGGLGPGYEGVFANDLPDATGKVKPNYVWSQATVVRAALMISQLKGDTADLDRTAAPLPRYLLTNRGTTGWAPPIDAGRRTPPPARWWDDNGVTGWTLLDAAQATPGRGYLREVEGVWPFVRSGQWPQGGQHENETPTGQSASVGATGYDDMTAERLYLATSPQSDPNHAAYLALALKNDRAIKAMLRAPDGLYFGAYYPNIQSSPWKWCDSAVSGGRCTGQWRACNANRPDLPPIAQPADLHICGWRFDDNQGVMIASDVLLYRITCRTHCDDTYLTSALKTADASLNYYGPRWLWASQPVFNAQYYVNLFELDRIRHDPRIRASLKAYLDRVWREARDPETGLFDRGGVYGGKPQGSIDQAAFVIMYALLAEHPG